MIPYSNLGISSIALNMTALNKSDKPIYATTKPVRGLGIDQFLIQAGLKHDYASLSTVKRLLYYLTAKKRQDVPQIFCSG